MARYETKFAIGQIVYVRMDKEQTERLLLEIRITPGSVIYSVSDGYSISEHYDLELSHERDMVKVTA